MSNLVVVSRRDFIKAAVALAKSTLVAQTPIVEEIPSITPAVKAAVAAPAAAEGITLANASLFTGWVEFQTNFRFIADKSFLQSQGGMFIAPLCKDPSESRESYYTRTVVRGIGRILKSNGEGLPSVERIGQQREWISKNITPELLSNSPELRAFFRISETDWNDTVTDPEYLKRTVEMCHGMLELKLKKLSELSTELDSVLAYFKQSNLECYGARILRELKDSTDTLAGILSDKNIKGVVEYCEILDRYYGVAQMSPAAMTQARLDLNDCYLELSGQGIELPDELILRSCNLPGDEQENLLFTALPKVWNLEGCYERVSGSHREKLDRLENAYLTRYDLSLEDAKTKENNMMKVMK